MPWPEQAAVAWFGPEGFASGIYGLIVLDSGAPGADGMFHLVALPVVLSIVAQSSTDVPIAQYFARQRQRASCREQVTLEGEDDSAPSYAGVPADQRTRQEPPPVSGPHIGQGGEALLFYDG